MTTKSFTPSTADRDTSANMNSDSAEWCRMCKVGFNSWEAYHMHKLQSKKHIVCTVCSADFNTHAGKKRHYDLVSSIPDL